MFVERLIIRIESRRTRHPTHQPPLLVQLPQEVPGCVCVEAHNRCRGVSNSRKHTDAQMRRAYVCVDA